MEELLARLAEIAEMSDEGLAEYEAELLAGLDGIGEDPTDEDLASMREIRDAVHAVRAQAGERYAAAEAAAAEAEARRVEAEALRAELAGETEDAADEEDAEGDPDLEGETEDATVEGDPEPEPVVAAAPEPVRRVVPVTRPKAVASRRSNTRITAAADLPNISAGARLDGIVDIAKAFVDRADALRDVRGGGDGEKVRVATIHTDYPEERQLSDRDPILSTERMENIAGERAIRASGGSCAPFEPQYDVPQISDNARPVKAALPSFQATRAGITWVPAPTLGSYDAGVAEWTLANDVNPTSPSTKPCVQVDCATVATAEVSAFTRCLKVGNFFNRSYPERVAAIVAILSATHARFTETETLTDIGAGSAQVTAGGDFLGASRTLLATIELAVEAMESHFRMMPGVGIRLLAPDWIHGLVRTDLTRQMPGDSAMSVSDATIDAWLRDRGVMPSYFVDGEAGQIFGAQGNGPLQGWPDEAICYLFHEGAWVFLDQGILDLGIVRDSTLNATNDLTIFAETFEGTAFRGIWSQRLRIDLCADGSTSAPITVDLCPTGS